MRYLFISGCGRSGTTLINKILARHPSIVLGVERYMKLFTYSSENFAPELFEFERFFDLRSSDSGQFKNGVSEAAKMHYKAMQEKWPSASFVGDKIPTMFERFDEVYSRFPLLLFVHITRHINEVVKSWGVRVSEGTLPSSYDYRKAVGVWNLALINSLSFYEKHPNSLLFIDYERIFQKGCLQRLFAKIDPSLNYEGVEKYVNEQERKSKTLSLERLDRYLDPQVNEYIEKHARLDLYKQVTELSVFS